jgi:hypothetical protein
MRHSRLPPLATRTPLNFHWREDVQLSSNPRLGVLCFTNLLLHALTEVWRPATIAEREIGKARIELDRT